MGSTTEALSLSESSYFYHHVFLPLRLPQSDDYNPKHEFVLIDEIICALRGFETYLSRQQAVEITIIITMMSRLRESCDLDGGISEHKLKLAFKELDTKGNVMKSIHKCCSFELTLIQVAFFQSSFVIRMLEY